MPNRLYNKQVTPKGYKAGGSVKAGPGPTPSRPRGGKPKPTPSKQPRKMGAGASARAKTKKPEIILLSAQKEGPAKRFTTIKEIPINFKKGGSALKPVNPQTQKGLSKLPTQVRNKMGYMQDGGKVKDKPGKNMVLGETFHPITENAMVNNIVKRFNSRDKKFASVNDLQDRHKEIKEKFFNKGVKPSEIQKLDKEFKSRLVKAKSRANKAIANRPGMKEYRKKQQKAKAIDTGSEN
jgi:hypothetical protein